MFSHVGEGIDRFSNLRWCVFRVAAGADGIFGGGALVFLWDSALWGGWGGGWGGSVSIFWGSFASIGEINFFLGMGTGGLGAGLYFHVILSFSDLS